MDVIARNERDSNVDGVRTITFPPQRGLIVQRAHDGGRDDGTEQSTKKKCRRKQFWKIEKKKAREISRWTEVINGPMRFGQ